MRREPKTLGVTRLDCRVWKKLSKRVQPESNRRPQDLQSHALPLSYAPESGGISAPVNLSMAVNKIQNTKKLKVYPTPRGFEPLRTKSTHLAGERLNHSAKASPEGASTRTGNPRDKTVTQNDSSRI